ncbi:hypothetical protein [Vibrio sp. WXL210]|uniref:hypothetical protein n=1 Tax=Vibrio sp. WXL210 TaxID=3450709 RepID=UPI003EC8D83C
MLNMRISTHLSYRQLLIVIGVSTIVAPSVHILTDAAEWYHGRFSVFWLWLNYIAFVAMPFVVIGLYAIQRSKIQSFGLIGALLYGIAFVYFAHTSLYAITENVLDYQALLQQLGSLYTVHGLLMVVGGIGFGIATYKVQIFPVWTSILFIIGIAANLLVAIIGAPEILQTIGSTVRNLGLIGMGIYLIRNSFELAEQA